MIDYLHTPTCSFSGETGMFRIYLYARWDPVDLNDMQMFSRKGRGSV